MSTPLFTSSRYKVKDANNFEVSTKGDKRFSALVACLMDGRTIETAYQLDVKGYRQDVVGSVKFDSWKIGKGKPSKNHTCPFKLYEDYKALWRKWLNENPKRRDYLLSLAPVNLTDMFASSNISQARALAELMNEYVESIKANEHN